MLIGYGVVSFGLLQVIEPIMHALHLPDEVLTYSVLAMALGFPVAIILGWAFDINAGKVERTPPSSGLRGFRLAALLVGLGLVAALPGAAWFFLAHRSAPPAANVQPSIAVLPLVNMSSDKEQEYFSDGLSEELLNLLAQLPQLRVIARTSSFSFKGKDVDVATIARALDVANILEGSVRKSGNKLRVTAQLIRAADSSHLWSQTYDRELTDVFKVQDEIANAVVAALKLKLLPGQAVENHSWTRNTEAYEQYLLGQQIMRRANLADLDRAEAALLKAVALDPSYAVAYAHLSALQMGLGELSNSVTGRAELHLRGVASAEKAIALDPKLALPWFSRAWYRCNIAWDVAGGSADVAHARELDPNVDALMTNISSEACFRQSQAQAAIVHDQKVLASDPLAVSAWQVHAMHLLLVPGRVGEARLALQRAIDLSPDANWPRFMLGFLELKDGKTDAALANFQHAGPGLGPTGLSMLAHTLGHRQESQRALDELKARYAAGFAIQIAWVYAWRGEKDLAFDWLDRAYGQHDAGLMRLRYDLPFASLHDDPRFAALVQKLNLPE